MVLAEGGRRSVPRVQHVFLFVAGLPPVASASDWVITQRGAGQLSERLSTLERPLASHWVLQHIGVRAMNAFNLGDLAAARTRLDRAASLSPPDADAYYSRGELLRDTDRPQAIHDFQRYLALTEATRTEHPTKRDRVHTQARPRAHADQPSPGLPSRRDAPV